MKPPPFGEWQGAKRRRRVSTRLRIGLGVDFFGVSSDFIHHSPMQGFEVTPLAAPIRKNSTVTNARKWWFRRCCQQLGQRGFAYSFRTSPGCTCNVDNFPNESFWY